MGKRRIHERPQIPEISLELYHQHEGLIIDAAKHTGLNLSSYELWQVENFIVRGISGYLAGRRWSAKPARWELWNQLQKVATWARFATRQHCKVVALFPRGQ